jgi:regulator of protease activity HflC (stomatin/prohibitin superfamily)
MRTEDEEEIELTSNTPVEKPKSWGFVAAKPSEYLVVYRRGQPDERRSGQGARVFKWPGDAIAVVPTTLKEVVFKANQITVDNVDVRVRGMVVYRIADPPRICRLINFESRESAEAKLARMLADLCRSSVKWLVANMKLEECLRRRKEAIAEALAEQVSQVVSSQGPDGWGVEVVTIDIQDVFVQDEAIFRAMQARFKAEREREERFARLELEREVERRKLETDRELEQKRHELLVEKAQLASAAALRQLELQRQNDEKQLELDRLRVARNEEILLFKAKAADERARLAAEATKERAAIEVAARQVANQEEARALRERLAAESSAGRASLERLFVAEALPELARALATGLDGARLSVVHTNDARGGPLGSVLSELVGVMGERLAKVEQPPA